MACLDLWILSTFDSSISSNFAVTRLRLPAAFTRAACGASPGEPEGPSLLTGHSTLVHFFVPSPYLQILFKHVLQGEHTVFSCCISLAGYGVVIITDIRFLL
jgi:hypothetical protein